MGVCVCVRAADSRTTDDDDDDAGEYIKYIRIARRVSENDRPGAHGSAPVGGRGDGLINAVRRRRDSEQSKSVFNIERPFRFG